MIDLLSESITSESLDYAYKDVRLHYRRPGRETRSKIRTIRSGEVFTLRTNDSRGGNYRPIGMF